jgi:flagella basal body P-ring formation protein FlgA
MADDEDDHLTLELRPAASITSNVLRLRDVCELSQANQTTLALRDIPLAPSPRPGVSQTWTREDISKVLGLRGLDSSNILWTGSESSQVVRISKETRPEEVATASATTLSNVDGMPQRHEDEFAPAFTTPVTIAQAERVVASAIESYLQLKSGASGKWRVKPVIPPRHASALMQRRQIISVAGGKEPWEGDQKFTLLLRTTEGESAIDIAADIQLPKMVVAAKGPIARGRILQEADLVWYALPTASKIAPEDCYCDFESLLGKQLRKAVSTQQPIRFQDVGEPYAVQAGDSVTIAVLAGSVRVEAYGRAVESGAIDEMIQVEVLPQKKRVAARVAAERRVEVIAGNGISLNP